MAEEVNELYEAEKAVIGGCLVDKDTFFRCLGELTADDFASEANRILFTDMAKVSSQNGGIIDSASLLEYLNSTKDIEKVGGVNYILGIVERHPLPSDVPYYINIVKDKSLARRFFNAMHQIENDYVSSRIEDIPDFIGASEKKILDITSHRRIADFMDVSQVLNALKEQTKADKDMRTRLNINDPDINGYPTGYTNLDKLSGGFHPGDLIILAARPSVGKTTLALNFASRIAGPNQTVGIFSLEMAPHQIIMKMLSCESHLSANEIRNLNFGDIMDGKVNGDKAVALSSAIKTLKNKSIYIDSESKLNNIMAKTKKLKTNHPDLALIVIDYLGMITPGTPVRGSDSSMQQQIAEITRSLKGMARDLQVPVLVLCQLSRAVEKRDDHEPSLSDLRDSGAIEQDADMVFFIYRPDYYKGKKKPAGSFHKPDEGEEEEEGEQRAVDPSQTTVYLSKNRNGRVGKAEFLFYKKISRFEGIADENEVGEEPEME